MALEEICEHCGFFVHSCQCADNYRRDHWCYKCKRAFDICTCFLPTYASPRSHLCIIYDFDKYRAMRSKGEF